MKFFILVLFSMLILPVFSQCALSVTNTADSGPGSFRQAIISANACTGAPTITFSIPSNSIINLLSDLPALTHANTNINGTTAPGYQYPNSMVTLVWPGLDDCIQINSGNNIIVRGLTFTDNFLGNGDGAFRVQGGNNLLIQYCKSYKSRKNLVRVQGGTNARIDYCTIQDFWYNNGDSQKGIEVNSGSLIQVSNCNIQSLSKRFFEMNNSASGGTNSKVSIYNNILNNVGYGDSVLCGNLPCGMNKGEHVIACYTSHTAVFSIRSNTLNGTFSKFAELINTKSLNGAGPRDSIYNNSIYNCRGQHTMYIEMNNNSPAAPAGQVYGGIVVLNNQFVGDGPNTYNVDQVIEIGGWSNNYSNALIAGNTIRNYHGRGIMFRYTDNTSIINNRIYNCSKDQGIELNNNCDNVTIQGNIIGTDSLNTMGLNIFSSHSIQLNECNNCVIGGNRQQGQGNIIIASNNHKAIEVSGACIGTTTIQGNDINVNAAGNLALSTSGDAAINIMGTTAIIGGDSLLFRNRISGGSGGRGIELSTPNALIQGNLIGCQMGGSPITGNNLNTGIQLNSGSNTIGSTSNASLINKIGYCQRGIGNNDQDNNLWSMNLFWANTANSVIENQGGSPNNSIVPPSITSVMGPYLVNGTASPNARVEVYFWNATNACQGHKYLGFTTANAAGSWTFTSPIIINSSIAALQILGNNSSQFTCQTVNPCLAPIFAGNDVNVCAGQSIILQATGGTNYTWNNNVTNGQAFIPAISGTYVVSGNDANGCSGIDTVLVNVISSSSSTANQTACESYFWNGNNYTQSGQYTFQTQNANGCDSTAYLNLTINNAYINESNVSACDVYQWNGNNYTQSGQYIYNATTINGCDSTLILNLSINQSNTSVLTVTAQDTYTWDLTGNTYTQSTSDTLILTNAAGCDSSIILILTIETSSLNNLIESKYNLRPNPADKFLIIDFNTTGLDHTIEIYDLYGKVVKVFKVMANGTILNIENLSPGIYSVFIDKRKNIGRFVKQ